MLNKVKYILNFLIKQFCNMFILAKCPQATVLITFYNNLKEKNGIILLFQRMSLQKFQFSPNYALILKLIEDQRIYKALDFAKIDHHIDTFTFKEGPEVIDVESTSTSEM